LSNLAALSGLDPSLVEEIYFGNVLSANNGQNPARQVALAAGLPNTVIATTLNKVCASGMKSIQLAALTIASGQADVVVAGGTESMSNVPYYLPDQRWGSKYGHKEAVDGIVVDGLWDCYNKFLMGEAAEICADEHLFSRLDQDNYAIESYTRAQYATKNKLFDSEIVPISVTVRGKSNSVVCDEEASNVSVLYRSSMLTNSKASSLYLEPMALSLHLIALL
jgi:acetyl-CoA C-acetyltransferase